MDARDFHRFCWNYFSSSLKIKKGKAKAKFCCNFSASKKVFELAEYEDSVVPPTSVKLVASACQKSAGPIQWSKHCQALIKLSILYLFILWFSHTPRSDYKGLTYKGFFQPRAEALLSE